MNNFSLPIRRRLMLCFFVCLAGSALFLPFLSDTSGKPISTLLAFVPITTAIGTLCAWFGLRAADAAALPMPLLRKFEGAPANLPPPAPYILSTLIGLLAGGFSLAALKIIGMPELETSLSSKILSVIFAAGLIEIVVHLGIMSCVTKFTGNRWRVGIAVSTIAFCLFHISGVDFSASISSILIPILLNGGIAAIGGYLYYAYGFEFCVMMHAVAHLVAVTFH